MSVSLLSPIEEAVLYMTVTSGEGAEYLVVNVSEKLSSLACAMSNGKIDLWNLDQVSDRCGMQGRVCAFITVCARRVRGEELASHNYPHLIEPRSLTVVFACSGDARRADFGRPSRRDHCALFS